LDFSSYSDEIQGIYDFIMGIVLIIEVILIFAITWNIVQDVFLIKSSRHTELEYAQDSTVQLWGFLYAFTDAAFLSLVTGAILYATWTTKMVDGFSIGGAIGSIV
jgi:hypothetical protein